MWRTLLSNLSLPSSLPIEEEVRVSWSPNQMRSIQASGRSEERVKRGSVDSCRVRALARSGYVRSFVRRSEGKVLEQDICIKAEKKKKSYFPALNRSVLVSRAGHEREKSQPSDLGFSGTSERAPHRRASYRASNSQTPR